MTQSSDLYSIVRTFLGDINLVSPGYSNDQLDLGIAAALLQDDTFSQGADTASGFVITPAVTAKADTARISIRAAVSLLSPSRGPLAWRTRVFSVSRNLADHMRYLDNLEKKITKGELVLDAETEWDQLARGLDNVTGQISDIGSGLG